MVFYNPKKYILHCVLIFSYYQGLLVLTGYSLLSGKEHPGQWGCQSSQGLRGKTSDSQLSGENSCPLDARA